MSRRIRETIGAVCHEIKRSAAALKGAALRSRRRRDNGVVGDSAPFELERSFADTMVTRPQKNDGRLDQLSQAVDDLLDLSHMTSGPLAIRAERRRLTDMVREAVEDQQMLWPTRSIVFDHDAGADAPVEVDPQHIRQIVSGYLANALKYVSEGRPVWVRLEVAGETARVSVYDAAQELPVYERERIWQRFHHLDDVEQPASEHLDLGPRLYLSRTIVGQRRGEVGVESGPGAGTTFWCTLPFVASSPSDR